MTNQEIWQAVLGEMEVNISKANFTTWFKNTFVSTIEEDKVIISVPNTFTKAWLEKKYHREIMQALGKVIEKKISEILYKVELAKKDNVISNISINTTSNGLGLNGINVTRQKEGALY